MPVDPKVSEIRSKIIANCFSGFFIIVLITPQQVVYPRKLPVLEMALIHNWWAHDWEGL
jgi:hypothetical protein